ncbi:MAG: tetratricopeptide repeat protein, partial [Acidobacteriota bacterium]
DRLDDAMALYDRDIAVLEAAGQEDLAEHLALRKLTLLDEAEAYDLLESAANEAIDSGSEALRFAGHVGRSQALAGRGDLDAALETLGTAAQTAEDARRRELLARRIGLLFDAARDDEARRLIEPFTAADSADDLFFAAQAWYRAERWAEAIPLLERVIEAAPEAVTPYFTLGAALERNGEIDRAVSTFESLLERMPDHAPTLNYLGYLWVDRGENLERALALIETAVAIDPENGAYIDSLGWAHFRLGDLDDARRVLEWAGRLVVDDPTVFEHLGDVYVALGEITSARRAYQRALDLDSDDADRIRTKLADLEPNQDIR